jgi:clan AA aspartic protease (TIGR02281 family)
LERAVLGSQIKVAIAFSAVALFAALKLAHGNDPQFVAVAHTAATAKIASQPQPTQRFASSGAGRIEHRIAADRQGQFFAYVEIDGKALPMLVDTGASSVALSYEDAAAAGIFPLPADYKYPVSTANGIARVAHVKLRNVRLGQLLVQDVDAVIGERGALGSSLLGMTFLSRLSHIEAANGALVLRQ